MQRVLGICLQMIESRHNEEILRRMRGMGVVPRMLDAMFFWVCENSRSQSIGVRIGVWK